MHFIKDVNNFVNVEHVSSHVELYQAMFTVCLRKTTQANLHLYTELYDNRVD